jgi:tetratricopeptide (TPR) repeat protein
MNELCLEPSFLLSTELMIFLTSPEDKLNQAMELPDIPYLQKGWDEFNRNNAQKASVWFGQALQEYIVRKDITGQFQSLRFLGEVCQYQERWTPAAKTYRQLLKVAQQMEDHEGAAIALINLAKCCHQLNDYNTAVSCLTDMFERAGQMGQTHLQAVALRNIGMVHASLYNYPAAITNFREEQALRQQLNDKEESMKALEAVGLMLFRMYDVQGAIKTFDEYLTMADQCGAPVYKGLALLGLGTFYDFVGDNETSIDYLRQSLSLFEGMNDEQNATVVLNNIGIYYRRICQFGTADKHFRQAYNIAKDNSDLEMQTRCLRNMALVANQMDDFGRSVNLIAESVRLAEKVNDRRLLAQTYRTQAEIFALLNNMEDAHKLYTICDGICLGTEDKVEHARCLCGLAELAAAKSPPDNGKALALFEQSTRMSRAIDYKKGLALASYGAGLVYRQLGDFAKSDERLAESVNTFGGLQNHKMHCRALAQLALCKCYVGSYEEALSCLQQANNIADPVRDKKGVELVAETEDVVTQLELLLVRSEPIVLKAQRRVESSGAMVGVLLKLTPTEIVVEGDGKKAAAKAGAEEVDTTLQLQSGLTIELDRTPKRLLIVRCPGQQKLEITCQQRSLLYSVLQALTMRMSACCGSSSAVGSCLSSMQVGVPCQFVVTAKTANGEAQSAGGDSFTAILRRKAPLASEPVHESTDAPTAGPTAAPEASGLRVTRMGQGIGEAYDISDGPIIVVEGDADAPIDTEAHSPAESRAVAASSRAPVKQPAMVTEATITDNRDGPVHAPCAVG